MTASMLDFARLHGSRDCIALASGDQGFAKILRYCRSLGCRTVAVCRCASPRLPTASSYAHMGSIIWVSRDGCNSLRRCFHSALTALEKALISSCSVAIVHGTVTHRKCA